MDGEEEGVEEVVGEEVEEEVVGMDVEEAGEVEEGEASITPGKEAIRSRVTTGVTRDMARARGAGRVTTPAAVRDTSTPACWRTPGQSWSRATGLVTVRAEISRTTP